MTKSFDNWWREDGRYIDSDWADVPWFDKRRDLAEMAFAAVGQCSELTALRETVRELREALNWYADSNNWKPGTRITAMGAHRASRAESDRGNRARALLEPQETEEPKP